MVRDTTSKKWDIKRGYGVYQSVYTEVLQRWIKEERIKEGEVLVWASGMSGWRKPEELDEFWRIFERLKKKEKKKEKKKKAPVVSARKKRKRKPKVIIIDDEKEICWLLENILKKRRFKVLSTNTGRDGLKLVRREQPDVVLLDLRLEDVDGLDVLRKIKKLRPKKKVIIVTAYGDTAAKKKAARLGSDVFVDKPFKSKEIVKAIKTVC